MALTSLNAPPPEPQPLGPVPQGHRRVMFLSPYNMSDLNAGKDEVRDVPTDLAQQYVRNGMAMMFDDLPPEPEPEVVEVERPAMNAPKAAWVDYAVSQGMNKLDAQCMTKADLQNEYNERL
jgi:hypothetical protein